VDYGQSSTEEYKEKRAFFLKSLDKLTYSDIIIIVIVTIREIKERRY
jgi:hypothetical protein